MRGGILTIYKDNNRREVECSLRGAAERREVFADENQEELLGGIRRNNWEKQPWGRKWKPGAEIFDTCHWM
ncbi:hypothetical protein CEXT_396741 [Caerostris extrusa]|uniref:Uncharacterized protein n=1 Tax=Caerostris extrusa TaxID=172846 RepID=A0AAV4W4E8_CAEEX|nr:hypothetical protein CEXT_396741 [Caerostris extrusa]